LQSRRAERYASWYNAEEVNDDQMPIVAHEIARKIESELEYPGQIKINVIRETDSSTTQNKVNSRIRK
jgi:HD superfamily phosphodiesterase